MSHFFEVQVAPRNRTCSECGAKILKGEKCLAFVYEWINIEKKKAGDTVLGKLCINCTGVMYERV